MPEQIGGRTYYSREEAEALGLTPTPEHLARARASFDQLEAAQRETRTNTSDPGSVGDIDPALRAQIQARADDVHAGTDVEGATLRDGAWYDAEGNLLYTQGPGGWYDPSGVLVYDLLGRGPNNRQQTGRPAAPRQPSLSGRCGPVSQPGRSAVTE